MMFKNDFIVTVKSDGKILREDGSTVLLPFGCEYSIYMKNLRAQKAQVSVSIDGVDVLGGNKLLINPNSTLDLERFLSDDMNKGNRFKFIQKTEKIQEHRGDRIDDGILRVTVQYEKQVVKNNPVFINQTSQWNHMPTYSNDFHYAKGFSDVTCDSIQPSMTFCSADSFSNMRSMNANMSTSPKTEEGITVKGSESAQSFRTGYIGELEEAEHVITLQLKGIKEDGQAVKEALTVKSKKICETCGTSNKSHYKFCIECGTYLT